MVDTPTTEYGLRQQELGTNVNTWGDDKLNEVIRAVAQIMGGAKAITMSGDYTLTSTNYVTTADNKNRVLVLGGTLTAASNLIVPSSDSVYCVINSTTGGYAVTAKTSAGTGISIPNGRIAWVYCDSVNVGYAVPTTGGVVTPTTASRDIPAWSAVEAAIANAALPASAGTVLVSGTDTTAGYLASKINATGTGAATVTQTVGSPGGNETVNIAVSVGALGLTDGGTQATGFTAAVNTRYVAAFGANGTITFPASATAGDIIAISYAGLYVYTHNPNGLKINTSTANFPLVGNQTYVWEYTGATDGWV